MEKFEFKQKGIRYLQIWHNELRNIHDYDLSNYDIVEFKESLYQLPLLEPFKNGVLYLDESLDVIFDKFDKGFKYEVRRAEKEGIQTQIIHSVPNATLQEIFTIYLHFSETKKIPPMPFNRLQQYNEAGVLVVSKAVLNNKVLQYHLYFASNAEYILLASFPGRDIASIKKSMLGFANRLLHWHDINYVYQNKRYIYNLGGIGNSENPETQGIVKFKMEMSPQVKTCYNGLIPLTYIGKLKHFISTLIKKYA